MRRIALVAVLLAVLVASALLWPRQRTGALEVPTSDRPAAASGVVTGRLDATRDGDRVCFTVAADDGPALLVFPAGWGADAGLGLLDPTGVVVAPRGTVVRVVGEPGEVGRVSGCPGSGRVWTVSAVRFQR